jgi:preprotein translocase subunit SecE
MGLTECFSMGESFPWIGNSWEQMIFNVDSLLAEMFTWGFFLSTLFFVSLCSVLAWASFSHPRGSEFLIETEAEMRKVSWPTTDDLISSSTVVVCTVILLSFYLGLIDFFLGNLFERLLL